MSDYKDFLSDDRYVGAIDAAGVGLRRMLDRQLAGHLGTWDVQCSYHMIKNRMWAVEPRLAMTKNIGFGGGVHAKGRWFYRGDTAKYWNFRPKLEHAIEPNDEIVRQFRYAYFNPNICVRAWRKLCRGIKTFSPLHDAPIDI